MRTMQFTFGVEPYDAARLLELAREYVRYYDEQLVVRRNRVGTADL